MKSFKRLGGPKCTLVGRSGAWLIFFIAIIVAAFLASCKTSDQKLAKLIRKNPHLVKTDTLYRNDTVFISSVEKDTLFFASRDTVIIKNDRLTIKHFFNVKDSTIYIAGKCDSIVYIEKDPIVVNQTKPQDKTGIPGWQVIGISIALILFTILATTLYHSFKKKRV